MSGQEVELVQQAFADNWIAPVGPYLRAFEDRLCDYTGAQHATALSSGTAAIHLALLTLGVQPEDEVMVSTLTFAATINPIIYIGAKPIFIDSEKHSWNLDPALLEQTLRKRAQSGHMPKAVLPVHLYGQSADMEAIMSVCNRYDVPVVEDAAEALGSSYNDQHPGAIGHMGVFSFNGNKIITTSGGGMLVSDNEKWIEHARKLSRQSREPGAHYEHIEIGYNYRMSNILAAIGYGQMAVLEDRVQRKREIYAYYQEKLGDLPGVTFTDEMPYGRHTRWLSVILIDPKQFGADREEIRLKLEEHNIESRPVWKPMHLQPIFRQYERIGGEVSEFLFERGLCLPSGTAMTDEQLDRIVSIIRTVHNPQRIYTR